MTDFDLFNPQAAEVRLERMQLESLGVTAEEVENLSEMLRNALRVEELAEGLDSPVHKALRSAAKGLIKAAGLTAERERDAAVGGVFL